MKNILILAFLTLSFGFVSGQYNCPPPSGGGGNSSLGSGGGSSSASSSARNGNFGAALIAHSRISSSVAKNKSMYADYDGSPFLNQKAIPGTLVLENGTEMKDVPLQVDLYSNSIIATNEDGEELIIDSKFYKEVVIPFEGKNLVFRKVNPKEPTKYYEVLYDDDNLVFFKKQDSNISKGSSSGYSHSNGRFRTSTQYFIKHDNGEVAHVKLKKKDIFAGFMDAELYAMKDYAKRKGIKLRDESDFVAVFKGVNTSSQED